MPILASETLLHENYANSLYSTLWKILKLFLFALDLEARQLKTEAMLANHEARIATSERDVTDCDGDG